MNKNNLITIAGILILSVGLIYFITNKGKAEKRALENLIDKERKEYAEEKQRLLQNLIQANERIAKRDQRLDSLKSITDSLRIKIQNTKDEINELPHVVTGFDLNGLDSILTNSYKQNHPN